MIQMRNVMQEAGYRMQCVHIQDAGIYVSEGVRKICVTFQKDEISLELTVKFIR